MGIQRLPKNVSATIVSTSSVHSQITVLKELVENSIDAINGHDNQCSGNILVEVDKDSAGLEYLSVSDNGCGVKKSDRGLMCLSYTTSKLHSVDELNHGISTCGFRGEALNLIARLSTQMSISTKTSEDKTVETWVVNQLGISTGPGKHASGLAGTTVKVNGLFKSTPVRHKFLTEKKNKINKEILELLTTFALVHRNIRFQLKYVKVLPKGKIVNGGTQTFNNKIPRSQFIYEILEIRKKEWLETGSMTFTVDNAVSGSYQVDVEYILPKMRAQDIPAHKTNLKIVSVNNRPMNLSLSFGKNISNKINEAYSECILVSPPVWFIAMRIPADRIDVNIEPEKSDIIIAGESILLERFKSELIHFLRILHDINSNAVTPDLLDSKNKDTIAPLPMSASDLDNVLNSDDESFIQELDCTVKKIQQKCMECLDPSTKISKNEIPDEDGFKKDIENGSFKGAVPESPANEATIAAVPSEANNSETVNNPGSEVDVDNEWSRTVYDTTDLSSGIEIPSGSSGTQTGDANAGVDPSHISISNPWTIAKLSKQIHEATKDMDDTLVTNESIVGGKKMITSTQEVFQSTLETPSVSSKKPRNIPKTKTPGKQTILSNNDDSSSIVTHKKRTELPEMPKIIECTQKTLGLRLQTEFVYSLSKHHRNKQILDDETWVHRSGIPSNEILIGALELYQSVDHTLKSPLPVFDTSHKIYKLK